MAAYTRCRMARTSAVWPELMVQAARPSTVTLVPRQAASSSWPGEEELEEAEERRR